MKQKILITISIFLLITIYSIFPVIAIENPTLDSIIPIKTFNTGLDAIYNNPAYLSNIQQFTCSFTNASFFENLYTAQSFSFGTPIADNLIFAFSVPVKKLDNLPQTIESNGEGQIIGAFSDLQTQVMTALTYKISNNLSLGTTITYLHHTIADASAQGYAISTGALLTTKILDLGINVKNLGNSQKIWSTGTNETLPISYNLNAVLKPIDFLNLYADFQYQNNASLNTGLEIILNQLSLDFAVQDTGRTNLLNCGVSLNSDNLKIDYNLVLNDTLGQTHKFGVTVSF